MLLLAARRSAPYEAAVFMLTAAAVGRISRLADARLCGIASVHLVCDTGQLLGLPLQARLLEAAVMLAESCGALAEQHQDPSEVGLPLGGYSTATLSHRASQCVDIVPVQDIGTYIASQLKAWQAREPHQARAVSEACSDEVQRKLKDASIHL